MGPFRQQAGRVAISAQDSALMDAFSRMRVSNPASVFDNQQQFGDNDLIWTNATSGGGSVSNQLTRASVLLSTGGTTSGAYAYRQSKPHIRYQPLKSQLVSVTMVMGDIVSNARRRVGQFDDRNGFFLEQSDDVYFVIRSYVTGSAVDTRVAQADWNVDRLDGRGVSGYKLDLSKVQILLIDYQALYAGRVRFGFDLGGRIVVAHEVEHANVIDSAYATNVNLPLRFEVENTGTAGSTATLEQICGAVVSEGGFTDDRGEPFAIDSGSSLTAVTARVPLVSIRARAAGPNAVLNIGQILPQAFEFLAEDASARFEVILNPSLTGAAWAAVDAARSLAEYDVTASALTGGVKVLTGAAAAGSGFFLSGAGTAGTPVFSKEPIVYDTLAGAGDILTIAATSLTGTSNVWAGINWKELY